MWFKLWLILVVCALLLSPLLLSAQGTGTQELNVTTYYLAPNATYVELRAARLGVGSNYYNSTTTAIGAGAALIVENNMGINSTTPQAKLHVGGFMKIDYLGGTDVAPIAPNIPLVCWKTAKTLGTCSGGIQQGTGSCTCQ